MSAGRRARVLLADDHRIVAEGLSRLLAESHELVATVHDGTAMVEAALRLAPDVVVTDISMPGKSGMEAMRELRAAGCDAWFVVLTMHDDPRLADEAIRAGAAAYVVKDRAGDELLRLLDRIVGGDACAADPPIPRCETSRAKRPVVLTARQRDVLGLLARGRTMKEIGRALALSPRTVESHKYRIMELLGATTTADLVQFAVRAGLVDRPSFSGSPHEGRAP